MHELRSGRIDGVPINLRGLEQETVAVAGVAAVRHHQDRVLGRQPVEVGHGRKGEIALEERVDPVEQARRTRRSRPHHVPDATFHLGTGRRTERPYVGGRRGEHVRHVEGMPVGFHETREQCPAGQVDELARATGSGHHLVMATDGDDAAILDGDGLGRRLPPVEGDDWSSSERQARHGALPLRARLFLLRLRERRRSPVSARSGRRRPDCARRAAGRARAPRRRPFPRRTR